ncbi:Integrase core domain-containing protein [Streptomyces sp. DvalAA-14]|uniref:integrase n=1 Tax=unclassified Streptomyces TaxID=2593676 RepID=UPI00081B0B54|nr:MULTISPECIES: integrase [unclassified Streptomyces]SCD31373.1 Integrase core domain-containing protein [Streptomyces sp. DvalAA-14]
MSNWTVPLRAGLALSFQGEQFTVSEVQGRQVLLQQSGLGGTRWRLVDVAGLLADPSTQLLVELPDEEESAAVALGLLDEAEEEAVTQRFQHVQEVRFGYRLGSVELALEGEPRPDYAPGVSMMHRYLAKAEELGVGESTIRLWVTQVKKSGPAGLLRVSRHRRKAQDRVDHRWLDVARTVVSSYTDDSRPVRALVLLEIEERVAAEYGRGTVKIPPQSAGYEVLRELDAGTNAFTGSTKGKRSIANRPQTVYGRLRATRPGEFVLLDTTRLDVFAMEPVTCRWVQCELTAAMDLYDRCITGIRLTPVSTKAVDVAAVLYETVRPRRDASAERALPYVGVPSTVVVDARKLVDVKGTPLPSVAAETIVYDHGKVYLSNHLRSVCTRLEISLQPARPLTPTDKSPIERWFKTLNQGLLAALPGYKGPDVHSRGLSVEDHAFFFIDELETIIRQWIDRIYHRRHHKGLVIPEIPGLKLSPLEMFDHGVARAGNLRIPARPNFALHFLEQVWCTIHHHGVELHGLRYNGAGLDGLRHQTSSYTGVSQGKWPVSVDPGDIRCVYFQRPDRSWHALEWEHAPALNGPVSREALRYARKLALQTHPSPTQSGPWWNCSSAGEPVSPETGPSAGRPSACPRTASVWSALTSSRICRIPCNCPRSRRSRPWRPHHRRTASTTA